MFFMDVLYLHILFIAELITEDWALVRLNSWWTEIKDVTGRAMVLKPYARKWHTFLMPTFSWVKGMAKV